MPREKYCSDIDTRVRSVRTNANAWRGLRDMALVLEDIGERDQAGRLAAIAAEYRRTVLATIDQVTVRTVDPPFVPIALDGEEPVPDPITGTRLGSYWNLVVQSLLGSGVFRHDSPTATDILRYMQTNGGLCMGLIRVQSARAFWVEPQNIDDLYGVRYALLLQQRDEPDRALVSFYGKLAQGMTRDTFIDGESSGILPLDRFGRQMYLPPNSAANASFLQQLRGLLVQDWDMDDDGRAETLRLLFATPRHWLRDGARITVEPARPPSETSPSPPIRSWGPAASRSWSRCPHARCRPGPYSASACPTAAGSTPPAPPAGPFLWPTPRRSTSPACPAGCTSRRPSADRSRDRGGPWDIQGL